MFIRTEDTPNHNALKFLAGTKISENTPIFFNKIEEAYNKSRLAVRLFRIEEVEAVFFGNDFITITKNTKANWDNMKPEILMVIMDYILSGEPIMEKAESGAQSNQDPARSFIENEIVEIIDTRIRPAVAMDGGDIIFKKFEEETGTVYLELQGACSGCPSSTITLKHGIESMLTHMVPEVKSVATMQDSS